MRCFLLFFPLTGVLLLSSCSVEEEEEGPDYENMVMIEEEEEWITDQEQGWKAIAGDVPEPQERILLEFSEEKKENR